MNTRSNTRRERYSLKLKNAKSYPVSLCCINFMHDGNLGYLIRAAACFGAERVHVIGSVPKRKMLNPLSGSLCDFVDIKQHSSPRDFLDWAEGERIKLVSAEICEGSRPIGSYRFDFTCRVCLVVGNEETGVPAEILRNSDIIHIPMPGVGYCLNTSQVANILLYETVKQMGF